MEFQQLRGFFYSARLGNLTKAAEKMAITQSAVSQQVKSLEEELGVKLFNRFGPRKDLTSDGKLFLQIITPVIQEIDSLKMTFEDMKGNQRGVLTIAATTFMIMNLLPPILKKSSSTSRSSQPIQGKASDGSNTRCSCYVVSFNAWKLVSDQRSIVSSLERQ